ncbi:C2 domain [Dillenia turbinata]|uniref:C2 domain n=1 Tax=Dillenia turbinata TaxID=194707 RepID=A0AAN8VTA0_9MAGN
MTRVNCRIVQIAVMDAKNLEAVRRESKMEVYAKISINGISETVKRTPVDKKGKRWPAWNFLVNENAVTVYGAMLLIELYCKRTWKKDQYIGEVSVPMKDLFALSNRNRGEGGIVSYEVKRGSQKSQGEIRFSCSFSDVKTIKKGGAWKKWLARALDFTIQVVSVATFGTPVPISVQIFVDSDSDSFASYF